MSRNIAIVGAGLIGRILALECQMAGMSVTLFDRDNKDGKQSCAYTGAGMLAPFSELEFADPIITALGFESLSLWTDLLKKLPDVYFQKEGTLVLAHPQDFSDLHRFKRSIQYKLEGTNWQSLNIALPENIIVNCTRDAIDSLETNLPSFFTQGYYLPHEGQIDNKQIMSALRQKLESLDVKWNTNIEVSSFTDFSAFDVTIDCRGLGAKTNLKNLRGVRGELLLVEAPEVHLNRPIRLMHPRHPIYIVPRQNNQFIIGATSIESQDMRPLTVQSALELLSAACTVRPAFAEGSILESRVNCRPALPNNLPSITLSGNKNSSYIISINGLYRHGFLIAPKIARLVFHYIQTQVASPHYSLLFDQTASLKDFRTLGESSFCN